MDIAWVKWLYLVDLSRWSSILCHPFLKWWMGVRPIHSPVVVLKHLFSQDGQVLFWKSSNGFEVLDKNAQTWHLDQCQCVPFYVDTHREFYQKSFCFPVSLEANLLCGVHWDEQVLSQPQLHLFLILGVQNLGRKSFEPIFTRALVFNLDVKHVFHSIEFFWIQTTRWTKWDGAIKPFHVPFWVIQLDACFGKKSCTQDDVVFDIIVVNTRTFCRLICLFLSNLGNLKCCIVMSIRPPIGPGTWADHGADSAAGHPGRMRNRFHGPFAALWHVEGR